MFVPRALRLKGVNEAKKPDKPNKRTRAPAAPGDNNSGDSLAAATQGTSNTSPTSHEGQPEPKFATKISKSTIAPAAPEYIAQLAAGVELIFTDYAHQHPENAKWLARHHRYIDGQENFIHLTAILEHINIASLKPAATHILLQQAIQEQKSPNLQLSNSGFYVRRLPSTYPLSFIPQNSFSIVDDNGSSFWDQRTIYVEPHIGHLCKTPAKVAHWLQHHGQMKAKWLPIQAVETLYNSCAFVVLSGNVMHEDVWKKWRSAEKPEDWKIMTKAEHTKRTNEYLDMVHKRRSNLKRKRDSTSDIGDGVVRDD